MCGWLIIGWVFSVLCNAINSISEIDMCIVSLNIFCYIIGARIDRKVLRASLPAEFFTQTIP